MTVRRDGEPVDLRGAQRARILALLAVELGRPVSVDRLVDALWDDPPKTATKTVRVQVGEIRRRLRPERDDDGSGEVIATRPGAYELRVDPHQVDLHRFRSLVRQGGDLLQAGASERSADRYREALELWADPPLPAVSGLPEYAPTVAECESLALAAREGLLLARLEAGQNQAVLAEVEPLLVREPLREELYAMAMLALYREGRQADALAMYQRARAELVDELGVEPGERLRELEAAILQQSSALTDTADPATGFSPAESFVGRSKELIVLGDTWQSAVAGRGAIVLISGDPGVGKTRLARELVDQVESTGGHALWGSCAALGSAAPFGVLTSLLDQIRQLGPDGEAVVAAMEDRLADVPDDVSRDLGTGAGAYRRAVDAVVAALRGLTQAEPLLVVLDDLHEVDHATAGLLVELGQHIDRLPLVVVATARRADADIGPALASVLPLLVRVDSTVRIDLAPLTRAETERYLEVALGTEPSQQIVEAIWRRTSGNPLFTVELAAMVAEEKDPTADPSRLPEALRQHVRARLDALDAEARTVAEAVSVLGEGFPLSLAAAVVGDPELATTGLDGLVTRRLLRLDDENHYAFVHDLVQEAVLKLMPDDRRASLHLTAAAALEDRARRDPSVLDDVARHRVAALPREPDSCVRACLTAARRDLGLTSFADAARWAGAAVEACSHLDAPLSLELQAELLLGEALMRGGDPSSARPHLDAAADLARALDDGSALARVAFYAAADRIPTPTEDPATFALLEEAESVVPDDETELGVRILDFLSIALYQDDPPRAVTYADEAVVRAEASGDPTSLALAYNGRAMASAGPDDVDERLDLAARGIDAAKRAPDPESVIVGRSIRLLALYELGRMKDADAELDLMEQLADERREPRFRWMVAGWRGVQAMRGGKFDEAEAQYARALDVWEGRPTMDALLGNGIQMVALRLLQDRASEVLPLVQAAGTERGGSHSWLAVRALVAAAAGEPDEARQALADCLATEPASWPRDLTWAISVSTAAEAGALLGEPAATCLLPLLESHLDRHAVLTAFGAGGSYWGSLAHPAGLLAGLNGDDDRARALLEQALAEHERIGAAPFVERTERALAAV